jgi:ribose/xylose/arabinose/galactoside ABC-type transport system permease subunit
MTYIPPERDDALDQTRQLEFTPPPMPTTGDGGPVDPFAGQVHEVAAPAEPAPARDRVAFQFIWEAILLLLTLNALFMVYRDEDALFGDEFGTLVDALDPHALYLTPVLLAALAIGLSLRLGAVNLAVPAIAIVVGWVARPVDANLWVHAGFVAAAAVVAALVYVLLVAVFRVPPWFAGLALASAFMASTQALERLSQSRGVDSVEMWNPPNGVYVFAGAAVLAVAGGLIGLLPGVRDGFSAVKRMADGGERRAGAVFLLLGGTVLSMLLAAAAGFLLFAYTLAPTTEPTSLSFGPYGLGSAGVDLQLLAFVAALLGGTSLWGRRGGVLGTVLAVLAVWAGMVLWNHAMIEAGDASWQDDFAPLIDVGILFVALFVSFALDRLGQPKDAIEPEDDVYTQEMHPFEPTSNGPEGTGLFEPTLPDTNAQQRL